MALEYWKATHQDNDEKHVSQKYNHGARKQLSWDQVVVVLKNTGGGFGLMFDLVFGDCLGFEP